MTMLQFKGAIGKNFPSLVPTKSLFVAFVLDSFEQWVYDI